jgi:Flp pilus assembly pilin Flp
LVIAPDFHAGLGAARIDAALSAAPHLAPGLRYASVSFSKFELSNHSWSLYAMLNNPSRYRLAARRRRGQGLVEYALIIAGVALICVAGITMFGHKTSDMIDAVTVVLPGAHADDNGPIVSGQLVDLTPGSSGSGITIDLGAIQGETGTARLGNGQTGNSTGFSGLITDPSQSSGT